MADKKSLDSGADKKIVSLGGLCNMSAEDKSKILSEGPVYIFHDGLLYKLTKVELS